MEWAALGGGEVLVPRGVQETCRVILVLGSSEIAFEKIFVIASKVLLAISVIVYRKKLAQLTGDRDSGYRTLLSQEADFILEILSPRRLALK